MPTPANPTQPIDYRRPTPYPLGLQPEFDERSRAFPLRAAIDADPQPLPPYRYWYRPGLLPLDQGSAPTCVGHSGETIQRLGPVTNPNPILAMETYWEAQRRDIWPGENYEGTSVVAACDYYVERGVFTEYRWQFSLDDVVEWVFGHAPLWLGTRWDYSMFFPDAKTSEIHPDGNLSGFHAYTIPGGNLRKEQFTILNNWGRRWGRNGTAIISFRDLWDILRDRGQGVAPIEVKLPR